MEYFAECKATCREIRNILFFVLRGGLSMKLPKRVYETLWAVLFTSLLLLGASSAATKPSPQTWGEAVSGLQMTIYLDHSERVQSKAPKCRVELRNVGEDDLLLHPGTIIGNRQYPDAVVLNLIDSQGKSWRLKLVGPWFVTGRVDPMVLPLPVGSTFSFPVDLDKYGPQDETLKPGTYSLEAQFTGKGDSQHEGWLLENWKGTAISNRLRFEVSNQ
jgi:hypothetical protein